MNLVITDSCNRSCEYCFAVNLVQRGVRRRGNYIGWVEFVKAVDFLVGSNQRAVSLLGGEPTLHPRLPEMLAYLYARGLHAHVFTNAVVSERRLHLIREVVDRQDTSFLVNLNPPNTGSRYQTKRVDAFLAELGDICAIGVNVFRPEMNLSYVSAAFRKYSLKGRVRIGLCHPCPEQPTDFLRVSDYRNAYLSIMKLIRDLDSMHFGNIEVSLDCGFPLCLFSDEDLGILHRLMPPGRPISRCAPIIDIGIDLRAWPCFPLAEVGQISVEQCKDGRHLSREFELLFRSKSRGEFKGIFAECKDCTLKRRRLCCGGCHAYAFMGPPQARPPMSEGPTV
jgi:hypothetical protein